MGRISRLKSQKRTLLTYKVHFDIVPPYNIVGALLWRARLIAPAVDPAFLMEALKIDMKLRQVLPKLMGGVTYASALRRSAHLPASGPFFFFFFCRGHRMHCCGTLWYVR